MSGLTVRSLNKTYGKSQILHDVSFHCPPGKITGLLGPNGSGKTSIMRILTSLSPPGSGEAHFDGAPYSDLPHPGREVGVLLDASAHHPGRSVYETIRIAAALIGVTAQRVREVVEMAGLTPVHRRRFGALSLGMKQRVGLAIAFLGRPKFLILDEPVNGLDVESIQWLRGVLTSFSREAGGTVLISSHLLQELQSYADRVVIVSRGRVVVENDLQILRQGETCDVATDEPDRLKSVLHGQGISWHPSAERSRITVDSDSRTIASLALQNSLLVTELVPGGSRALERLYLDVTSAEFATQREDALYR